MLKTAILLNLVVSASLLAESSYRIVDTYSLGGDGNWDYVVLARRHDRLSVARQNRVMVIDEDTGKLLGGVTGINAAHRTAAGESTGRGFATSQVTALFAHHSRGNLH